MRVDFAKSPHNDSRTAGCDDVWIKHARRSKISSAGVRRTVEWDPLIRRRRKRD